MSAGTGIEWTDRTWNPVRGCSRVSEGCRNCYAERFAQRFVGGCMDGFVASSRWTGKVALVPEKLAEPLSWRKPSRVFVNSMSDLFHEGLADADIDRVFAVMAIAEQHTFQVLTKRPERMRAYMNRLARAGHLAQPLFDAIAKDGRRPPGRFVWPMPNVWLGVSVEDQASADERIPHLLATPAAVRFLSCEPLIGPVRLATPEVGDRPPTGKPLANASEWDDWKYWATRDNGVRWVIIGGESGPGARPCDVEWIRSLVAQCKAAGVACFVKQLGASPFAKPSTIQGKIDFLKSAQSAGINLAVDVDGAHLILRDRKGGDPSEWPEDLRVREFPEPRP